MSQLLVSVRSAEEAEAALWGGAALIDVKEPSRGPLGRADDETILQIVNAVAGRRPVSAALGELSEAREPTRVAGLGFAKWGLAGLGDCPAWPRLLREANARLREANSVCRPVAVAYADWQRANAPAPEAVAAFAAEQECGLLIDTFSKDGRTLLHWLPPGSLKTLCRASRSAGVSLALAGSLGTGEIQALLDLEPDWFAVRGAVCFGSRTGAVDARRVRRLCQVLRPVSGVSS